MGNSNQSIESVRVKPVESAVRRNHTILGMLVQSAMQDGLNEFATFPVMTLPAPIRFRRSGRHAEYTHIQAKTYAVGDALPNSGIRLSEDYPDVEIYPNISLRLQTDYTQDHGVVASISYANFLLEATEFAVATPDITYQLIPETFSVARGNHFDELNFPYGGRSNSEIGGPFDRGDIAWLAARAIDGASAAYGQFDQTFLNYSSRP